MVKFLVCVVVVVMTMDAAHAKTWRRAKGTLYVTRYQDSSGATLENLSPEARVIKLDMDLRRRSNKRGVKTVCKDVKRLRQRMCRSVSYQSVKGHGKCLYVLQSTAHNFTSSSPNIYTYLEMAVQCQSGRSVYLAAEGEVRRS